ncbi:hypothetical protein [Novosphingobium album (ex Liu et al. 2023)]|uniref:Uncharacterized protein n=1 Tax=Novosphingobium album (ex Liu et al. 2023) TaxID=3031130 RepID=A0ABT5WVH5_9SPHN|nr:hypothetical protein [Novosphingobium album (ex Liu et al. 2023)]MDE8653900.1 hypothetical protein [Novosphingobium album (ex Liu et al. 2023)]
MTDSSGIKKFLFLSDSDSEAAKSRLAVAGIPYIKKRLESGSANWVNIIDIIDEEPLVGILVKLSNTTMERMLHPEYSEVHDELLGRIRLIPHIIFVHSSFFGLAIEQSSGVEEDEDSWFGPNGYFYPLEEDQRKAVMELFERYELNVVPYRRNVELSLLAGEFVEGHHNNLIFRFYVPSGKIYAEQTIDVLSLFRDYLTRSLNMQVRQSTHATASGTVYEFFGDGSMSQDDVTASFSGFTRVMDLCVADPTAAERLLIEQGADAHSVGRLVTDYSKKLRRITSDIRQERERKILDIRHRLESELIEVASDAELATIRLLVEQVIPSREGVTEVMGLGTSRLGYAGADKMVVNIRPQFINQVTGVVAQEVYGNQNFGPEPIQLLELIRDSGLPNTVDLQSSVYEMEDGNSSPEKRLSAARRLQAFLAKVGAKAGDKLLDAGIASLQAYLQAKLG